MYPVGLGEILGILNLVELIILTYLFWKQRSYLKELFPKSGTRDIRNKFGEVIEALIDFEKKIGIQENRLREFRKEGLLYMQKLSISRYNPYNDTGGDQSFSFAILDGKLNGFILTSLHSRSGTRVYIKTVKIGKSELELSKEEENALQQAINS